MQTSPRFLKGSRLISFNYHAVDIVSWYGSDELLRLVNESRRISLERRGVRPVDGIPAAAKKRQV